MCSTVASNVNTTNTAIVTYGIRTAAQVADRTAKISRTQPAAYAAPRNAAVTGGWMVQAKYFSVLADRTNNTTKASAVSSEKAPISRRVPGRITSFLWSRVNPQTLP